MSRLENDLQTMLRERAHDVDTLPADFLHLPAMDVLDRDPVVDLAARRNRNATLIAAVVVAMLALAGGLLGWSQRGGDDHHIPTTKHSPSPQPSPTSGPRTVVGLDRITIAAVTGYRERDQISSPGFRQTYLKRAGDTEAPAGSNGGVDASAVVTVFDHGTYTPPASVLSGKLRIDSFAAYEGHTGWYLGNGRSGASVPSIAWQYRSGAWVLVQALTSAAEPDLATLAGAVQPERPTPFTVPFRLAWVPPYPITSINDDREGGYSLVIAFGRGSTIYQTLTIGPKGSSGGIRGVPIDVGGLTGRIAPGLGIHVDFAGGGLDVGATNAAGTKLDERTTRAMVRGLVWSGGDGSGPGVALRDAVPGS